MFPELLEIALAVVQEIEKKAKGVRQQARGEAGDAFVKYGDGLPILAK